MNRNSKTNTIYPRISKGNTKLGINIATVNLPACVTCRPDAPCFKYCYARKGNFRFKTVEESLANNYKAYLDNPKGYFDVIDAGLTMVPYRFFRWHSSGDIPCTDYLDRMCKLARRHKGTIFLCFTKRYEIVNEYLDHHRRPSNLILVFSNWGEWRCENPHNLPTAWVKFDKNTEIPEKAHKCPGYCGDCVNSECSCWKLKNGESVYFDKH